MFLSPKIWFVKTSARIVKHESGVVKLNHEDHIHLVVKALDF